MTAVHPARTRGRHAQLSGVAGIARAAMFAVAVGVFLSAPPSLPWVIALVAATNVVFLVARASMSGLRPPISLLLLNGLTTTLVIGYTAFPSTTL